MSRNRVAGLCLLLAATALEATPSPAGIVVERVVQGEEGDRAGIRSGDVLMSWTRKPNPPANPAGARGIFATPFDVLETQIDQSPRARDVSIEYRRGGERGSAVVLPYAWAVETRPSFSASRLKNYETARRLIETGEIEKGCQVWRTLAGELSASGDHLGAAWVWLRTARTQAEADRIDAALESFDLAIAQARAAGRADIESQLWGYRGEALVEANRFAEAAAAQRQALAIRERGGVDTLAVAYCLDQLVVDAGTADKAAQTRALRIWKRLAPGSAAEAASLTAHALDARYRGDFREALELQRQALAIHRQIDENSFEVAKTVKVLCVFEGERHNLAEAEQLCAESLALSSRFQGTEALTLGAASLLNLGQIAFDRGELERAKQLTLRALALRERAAGSQGIGHPLARLGGIALARGDYIEAEELLLRAEKLLSVALSPNHPYRAVLKNMLAEVAYGQGNLPKALALLREAAALVALRAPGGIDAAWICNDLGQVLARLGEMAEAEAQLRRALDLRLKHSPTSAETAMSRHDLGMLLWRTGRLTEAESELRRSIEDLESQQTRLGGSDEARSAFGAKFADFYRDYLRLLVEFGREEDAFLLLERYRAGSFLRTLAQRDLALSDDIPADLDRERTHTNEVYESTQGELGQLELATDAKKIEENLARLAELRVKQADIADRIRKASPRYGALRYPQPLILAATRAALDPGTLLLSYSVGETKSFLFAVASDPKRGPPLSVFTLPVGEKTLRESVDAFRRLIKRGGESPELLARSRSLYEQLLEPAAALIGKSDRLLILPDGPVSTLPWSALTRGVAGQQPAYLAEWRPISTVVSATVYAELKKARRSARAPAIQLTAFGDPRYPAPPPKAAVTRGDGTAEVDAESYGEPEIDAVLRGGHRFEPLPRSRQEVETIAALYAPRAEVFVGEQATEERAKAVGRDVPLIHYACHAYVNERFPLDSALVFTIPDKPREGQDNGLLQAWEIFEKVRIDADLVTLSACETGLGKEMGGEGLIGLTRAFQYAGARSVLASLWKVEDASTAELMKLFYGYLKAGHSKDEALQLAQIDLIRSTNFSQPRDWAAFELSGDWK